MPTFPNINTLGEKSTLSGEEVIQISATEKTTLRQIVEQLGFTPNSELTGLVQSMVGKLNLPQATDSLIEAISKLVSLVGGNKLFISPIVPVESEDGDIIQLVVLVDNTAFDPNRDGGLVASIEILQDGYIRVLVSYRLWGSGDQDPLDICENVNDLYNWVSNGGNNTMHLYYQGEYIQDRDTSNITFRPGDIIFHVGSNITSISIPIDLWNTPNRVFSQNSSIIITRVNVTRSMFNAGSGGNFSDIVYLFSDGFDDNPNTEYQCITLQKVRSFEGKAYIMVNKGGYDTYIP